MRDLRRPPDRPVATRLGDDGPRDVRCHPASRPRRRRRLRRPLRRSRSATTEHHRRRRRPPADLERGRQRHRGLQRRDLQLPRAPRGAPGTRALVRDARRHRGARPWLGGVRCRRRRASARNVRVRRLGCAHARSSSSPSTASGSSLCTGRTATDGLVLGSELSCVLASGLVGRELDLQALVRVLRAGLRTGTADDPVRRSEACLPQPRCACAPGRSRRSRPTGGRPALARQTAATREQIRAELLDALRDAVRSHLVSDVPLGAFLSGGIDSSVIVALMARGLERTRADVLHRLSRRGARRARQGATRRRAATEPIITSSSSSRAASTSCPKLVSHFAEPFADPSALPTYHVSSLAARHVKVALSGDGGDELFVGYTTFQGVELARTLERVPRVVSASGARRLGRRAAPAVADGRRSNGSRREAGGRQPRRRHRRVPKQGGAHGSPARRSRCSRRSFERSWQTQSVSRDRRESRREYERRRSARALPPDEPRRLAAVGHARQGRPSEHGVLARGPRAASSITCWRSSCLRSPCARAFRAGVSRAFSATRCAIFSPSRLLTQAKARLHGSSFSLVPGRPQPIRSGRAARRRDGAARVSRRRCGRRCSRAMHRVAETRAHSSGRCSCSSSGAGRCSTSAARDAGSAPATCAGRFRSTRRFSLTRSARLGCDVELLPWGRRTEAERLPAEAPLARSRRRGCAPCGRARRGFPSSSSRRATTG